MKDLSFLKKVTLEEVPVNVPGTREGSSTLVKQPINGDLRVFKNGRVFPSDAFMATHELEYLPKIESVDPVSGDLKVTVVGNGLDIFSSTNWSMVKGLEEEVIFCAIVPRQGSPKIDLWGSCQYKDGLPVTGILDQSASTFGKTSLVDMLADAYGVDWNTTKFVDIKVETDYPMQSESGIYHLPKVVARGENKGKATYVRRELINIFPLTVLASEQEKEVSVQDASDEMFEAPKSTKAKELEPVTSDNGEASDDLLSSLL